MAGIFQKVYRFTIYGIVYEHMLFLTIVNTNFNLIGYNIDIISLGRIYLNYSNNVLTDLSH